jgi:hypothetical protein
MSVNWSNGNRKRPKGSYCKVCKRRHGSGRCSFKKDMEHGRGNKWNPRYNMQQLKPATVDDGTSNGHTIHGSFSTSSRRVEVRHPPRAGV